MSFSDSTPLSAFSLYSRDKVNTDHDFTAEQWTEEATMMYQAAKDFIAIEAGNKVHELAAQRLLMEKAADQGFTAAHIDEEYGGLNLDVISNTVLSEAISLYGGSFNTTFAAHIGIGMLPIYFFGTEAQKQKYLPKLARAEMIASYCLTEPSSGSDALAAKTEARLSKDGRHYVLNGQKMWITNAGFANLFIVFAKIDGQAFTCFLVDADSKGISLGAEEKKMGIKGSSTRQVFFEDVEVPVENILGEPGKGHLIAFNVLNIGRFKLGVMCLGGAITILKRSIDYAIERHQFGHPIASFGAIQYKLAEATRSIFALDSLVYRTAGLLHLIEEEFVKNGQSPAMAAYNAAKEMAMECAAIKVAGSECVDYCSDENIQIHGGMGFSEETDAPLIFRDARINRIYEGTNEINRLLIVSRLGKMAKENHRGFFELLSSAVQRFMANDNDPGNNDEDTTSETYRLAITQLIGQCFTAQAMGEVDLVEDQQTSMALSDIIIEWLQTDSILVRVNAIQREGHPHAEMANDLMQLQMNRMHHLLMKNGEQVVLGAMKDQEAAWAWLNKWKKELNWRVLPESDIRTRIAKFLTVRPYYPFRDMP